jgi:capsular polysaccharide biosynthesis protein
VICSDAIREGIVFTAKPVRRLLLQTPRAERRIAGRAVLFGGTENFGHILTDFLSKFSTAWPRDEIDHILLSSKCHRAAADFLRKLGFADVSIVRQRENEVLRVEHLIAPSLTHRFPELPVDYVAWLRRQFMMMPPAGAARKRIAISRRGAVGRHFANAEEMHAVYSDFGIEEVDFSALSLDDQLVLLGSAELLLGAGGAGTAGALFVAADCLVVELRDPSWSSMTGQYPRALKAMGHRYRVLKCASLPIRTPTGGVDMTLNVPISALRALLAEELR